MNVMLDIAAPLRQEYVGKQNYASPLSLTKVASKETYKYYTIARLQYNCLGRKRQRIKQKAFLKLNLLFPGATERVHVKSRPDDSPGASIESLQG